MGSKVSDEYGAAIFSVQVTMQVTYCC